MEKKSGAIYWFQCEELACDEEYIGYTSRTLGETFKEHLKDPLPIHHHSNTAGHLTTKEKFQTMGRKDHGKTELSRNLFT